MKICLDPGKERVLKMLFKTLSSSSTVLLRIPTPFGQENFVGLPNCRISRRVELYIKHSFVHRDDRNGKIPDYSGVGLGRFHCNQHMPYPKSRICLLNLKLLRNLDYKKFE